MPRGNSQKLKLYTLAKILEEETDEQHPMTMPMLLSALARAGIEAERKSVYDDLRLLEDAGMDILRTERPNMAYYCGGRLFELPELLALADAVLAARFLTPEKSRALVTKLGTLAGKYEGRQLLGQLRAAGRRKTKNTAVYYTMDALHRAIAGQCFVTFHYFEWMPDFSSGGKFRPRLRREGALYSVAPKGLVWAEDNDYLVGYDDDHQQIRNYRVDRMTDLLVTERKIGRLPALDFDLSAYADTQFGMFAGTPVPVTLRFPDHLANAAVDFFGLDAFIAPDTPGFFTLRANVSLSPRFYAWVLGFDGAVTLCSPDNAVTGLRALAENSLISDRP